MIDSYVRTPETSAQLFPKRSIAGVLQRSAYAAGCLWHRGSFPKSDEWGGASSNAPTTITRSKSVYYRCPNHFARWYTSRFQGHHVTLMSSTGRFPCAHWSFITKHMREEWWLVRRRVRNVDCCQNAARRWSCVLCTAFWNAVLREGHYSDTILHIMLFLGSISDRLKKSPMHPIWIFHKSSHFNHFNQCLRGWPIFNNIASYWRGGSQKHWTPLFIFFLPSFPAIFFTYEWTLWNIW